MGGRVGGLVQVDNTGADVGLDVALQRGSTARNGSEMSGLDLKLVVVLEEEAISRE
jgi:microcompartment protein CcmK/EutM